jgi:hypothetical protein
MNASPEQGIERADEPGVSTRDLADLARAGYEMLQEPFTHIYFEVHHTEDRAGYLRDEVFMGGDPDPADADARGPEAGGADARDPEGAEAPDSGAEGSGAAPASIAIEVLTSAANGVALVIGTNRGLDAPDRPAAVPGGGLAAATVADGPNRRVFRGTALPNPAFLFESALTYEGIVAIDPAQRGIRFHQSVAVRDLIREISRVAAHVAKAPLLFLQCPAQLPDHVFIGQDVKNRKSTTPKRSSALAVRFAIALQRPSARLRVTLTDILMRYCTEHRFGFWLADTRIGYRSGNWFQICTSDEDLSKRDRRERVVSNDSHVVDCCLPITFVGPARAGSTHTIVSFLCKFKNLGVLSAALTTLDDLAFIHFQLSVAEMRRSNLADLNSRLGAGSSSWAANPAEAIRQLYRVLVPDQEAQASIDASDGSGRIGDYQTLAGPALNCVMPDRERRIAVWFSWQMEGVGRDLASPLVELLSSLEDMKLVAAKDVARQAKAELASIEYLIFRDVGNSVLRGRGKFSIPERDILALFQDSSTFHDNPLEVAAVKLCMGLEDAWKSSLRRKGVRGVSELTVSWREWWLGHWASPI